MDICKRKLVSTQTDIIAYYVEKIHSIVDIHITLTVSFCRGSKYSLENGFVPRHICIFGMDLGGEDDSAVNLGCLITIYGLPWSGFVWS